MSKLSKLADRCITDVLAIAKSPQEEFDKRSAIKKRVGTFLVELSEIKADINEARDWLTA